MKLAYLNEATRWAILQGYRAVQAAWNMEQSDWALMQMHAGKHPAFLSAAEQFDQAAYRAEQIAAGKSSRVAETPLLLEWKAAMREQFEDFV